MHEERIDQLSLFPKRVDHNAKRTKKNKNKKHENKEQGSARLNMKRSVVKATKPHKIRITPGPPP